MHEYILVGPTDSGAAGLPWETWGFGSPHLADGFQPAELADSVDAAVRATRRSLQAAHEAAQRGEPPPFEADGFARDGLGCARFQVSAGDCADAPCGRSDTVAFRRV